MLKYWSRSPEISVDDVAKRVGSFALIVYDINVSSLDSGEKESLAFLRPVFRRFNCPRLIYVKPGYVLCVFDDLLSSDLMLPSSTHTRMVVAGPRSENWKGRATKEGGVI